MIAAVVQVFNEEPTEAEVIEEKMSQPIESKESKRLLFIDQANL